MINWSDRYPPEYGKIHRKSENPPNIRKFGWGTGKYQYWCYLPEIGARSCGPSRPACLCSSIFSSRSAFTRSCTKCFLLRSPSFCIPVSRSYALPVKICSKGGRGVLVNSEYRHLGGATRGGWGRGTTGLSLTTAGKCQELGNAKPGMRAHLCYLPVSRLRTTKVSGSVKYSTLSARR